MAHALGLARPGPRAPAAVLPVSGAVRVRRLLPAPAPPAGTPLVLVPSLFNRWTVFDLHPRRSLAAFLRDRGLDVWIVDWGTPPRRRGPDFAAYVDRLLRGAVDRVAETTGSDRVSLLGYSVGGMLSALFAARAPARVRNLVTLGTPIACRKTGVTAAWSRMFPVEAFVAAAGQVPASFAHAGFATLAAMRPLGWWRAFGADMASRDGREVVAAVRHWIGDGVPISGPAYRDLVARCYRQDALLRGTLEIGGAPVSLRDVTAAVLIVVAAHDHLAPARAALPLGDLAASDDVSSLRVPGSHLGAVVGHDAPARLWGPLADWISARSAPEAGAQLPADAPTGREAAGA